MEREVVLKGVSISPGIAIGSPFYLFPSKNLKSDLTLSKKEVVREIERYRSALKKSKTDLQQLQQKFVKEGLSVVVAILEAHLEILHDPFMTELVEKKIQKTHKNTETVFEQVLGEYKKGFSSSGDEFFQERIKDVKDVSFRILNHLRPLKEERVKIFCKSAIIIAKDLIPSDAFETKLANILAFVTQRGGYSSHAGIIARAKGIPYVAKIDINFLKNIEISNLIIDGINGVVIVNPLKSSLEKYKNLQKNFISSYRDLKCKVHLKAITKDKVKIDIFSNVESFEDIELSTENFADGVGLFRSEYIFLKEKKFPIMEKQFKIYQEMAKKLKNRPFTIRLFDIGGDKNHFFNENERERFKIFSNYFEINPVLGCRAIRFLMKNEKILEDQIEAILRASAYGDIRILIPFVCDISEVRYVKQKLKKIRKRLVEEGVKIKKKIPLGIMVEVPAAAIMIDDFMKEIDFCSIGTNDLMQCLMAADRGNPDTSHLLEFIHPSFFRILSKVIEESKLHKKPLSICGEMAADPRFTEVFIGSGIKQMSMAPRHIPIIKEVIRNMDIEVARDEVKKAFGSYDLEELNEFILKN
jgi:phosphotransferase system enzyme I (PtsI)